MPSRRTAGRTEHQRDRDRIVHSTAFRRLVYKTQVFLNHEGDLFRTRLTHSLEVAQLGRSVARMLRLNEDLVEAIALAHDLGHTPFGHAGQDALHACMAAMAASSTTCRACAWSTAGAALPGLRRPEPELRDARGHPQALLARNAPRRWRPPSPAAWRRRFIDGTQPSLEAQLVNLADEIAYNAHDIDDGVRSGLLDAGQLANWRPMGASGTRCWPTTRPGHTRAPAAVRGAAPHAVAPGARTGRLHRAGPARRRTRRCRRRAPLAGPGSLACRAACRVHRAQALPVHCVVPAPAGGADHRGGRRVVVDLFAAYVGVPAEMPADFQAARPATRGGRLHRRHDRPLRAARIPPPDRSRALPGGLAARRWPRPPDLPAGDLAMARLSRLSLPGVVHYVLQRGHNGGAIVRDLTRTPSSCCRSCVRPRCQPAWCCMPMRWPT
jgi:dGTPase